MRHSRILSSVLLFVALIVPFLPRLASAAGVPELSVTPVVIDEKAKARDILKETITITNTSNRKLTIYPSVNNVRSEDGEQPFKQALGGDDLADSLANWIELSRGVIELGPGEEKAVPFVIRVNLNAVSGLYHARISFADGSTREQAEAKAELASVTVNLEVQADLKEIMQLNAFTTDNVVFTGDDVLFKYQLQNIGNQELQPKGEIRIYNRRGEEVASLDVNNEGKTVSPDQVTQLASVWSAVSGFGKYKALLDVDYGKSQVASVHDTVYFWVVPWKQILSISIITLVAVIFLVLHFHRAVEERHFGKLAMAGLLKAEALAHLPHLHLPRTGAAPALPLPPALKEESRVKEVITETIQEKKERFDRFKRQGFTPAHVAAAREESSAPQAAPSASHATIDLKHMWKQESKPVITENHVIDLKKRT